MSSTGLVIDPLASTDGTAVDVEKAQGRNRVKTIDDPVLDQLTRIADTLGAIHQILAFEFEAETEVEQHVED